MSLKISKIICIQDSVDLDTRPDRQLARDWQSRKSKETAGTSVHLHYPTFKGSSLGIGTVNGGTFNAG
ncbi:3276_t:CDS:2, partial [Ambispora gerdemannii]